jgi:hypothetical protein
VGGGDRVLPGAEVSSKEARPRVVSTRGGRGAMGCLYLQLYQAHPHHLRSSPHQGWSDCRDKRGKRGGGQMGVRGASWSSRWYLDCFSSVSRPTNVNQPRCLTSPFFQKIRVVLGMFQCIACSLAPSRRRATAPVHYFFALPGLGFRVYFLGFRVRVQSLRV